MGGKQIGIGELDEDVANGKPRYRVGVNVASFGASVMICDGGITLCTGVKVTGVVSVDDTVTGQKEISVPVKGGILIVVMTVYMYPSDDEERTKVDKSGLVIVVVEPS